MRISDWSSDVCSSDLELARLRSILREHPTAILFTHKTYIDGATPSRLAYDNDMPMLHLFGGANLDFAIMGEFFRRSGMIFVRRSFQDQPVYKQIGRASCRERVCQYV